MTWLFFFIPIIVSISCAFKTEQPSTISKTIKKTVEDCVSENKRDIDGYKFHRIKKGETIYRISRRYNSTVNKILEINNIPDHTDIPIGTLIKVPSINYDQDFIWPVSGNISSGYGKKRRNNYHFGIDIPAPKGTPIRATEDGLIILSGKNIRGFNRYGRIVVIEHLGRLRSFYAHNSKNLVIAGDCVRQGEIIAEVGSTGNSTGSHLHFELRKSGIPVNPFNFLY